ncbi:MAG: protocatechuate 3,4-dioxygenase [Methyloligellaceae bacterium]
MAFKFQRRDSRLLVTRRGLVTGSLSLWVASRPAFAALVATPAQTPGPFYPRTKPSDSDMDLTRIAGRSEAALGEVIEVQGRILSAKGEPLGGAIVEIWQADSFGRYNHPGDRQGRDANFQGYGAVRTGADGSYRFRTIRPRHYKAGSLVRTPHIHFRVVTQARSELITQMYFPDHPLNASDGIYLSLPGEAARQAATARLVENPIPQYHFNIVLV